MFNYLISVILSYEQMIISSGMAINVLYSALAKQLIITTIIMAILFFVFKSVALYKMCKNNNISHSFIAFIPFANYYLIGKLVKETRIFSVKIKNLGLITGIMLLVMTILSSITDYLIYFDEFYAILQYNNLPVNITYPNTTFLTIFEIVSNVFFYITFVFVVFLNIAFIPKYNRRYGFIISLVLTLLFSELFYLVYNLVLAITIFTMRKNKPIYIRTYVVSAQPMQQPNYDNRTNTQNVDDPFDEFSQKQNSSGLEQDIFSDFTPDKDFTNKNQNNDEN